MRTIEVIFAEFGPNRKNNGNFNLPPQRLEPSLSTIKKILTDKNLNVKYTLYTNNKMLKNLKDFSVVLVENEEKKFNTNHKRYNWHCNDYYKVLGLLKSKSDYAVCTDSDMFYISEKFLDIFSIVDRFGLALPKNPRNVVANDSLMGADGISNRLELEGGSYMMANNMSPIIYKTSNERANFNYRHLLEIKLAVCFKNTQKY